MWNPYLLRVGLVIRRRAARLRRRLVSGARPVLHLGCWRLHAGLLEAVEDLDVDRRSLHTGQRCNRRQYQALLSPQPHQRRAWLTSGSMRTLLTNDVLKASRHEGLQLGT